MNTLGLGFSIFTLLTAIVVYYFSNRASLQQRKQMEKIVYPEARRDDSVVDDYHGTKIADPYRWLEDPDSEETKAFVTAQNKISKPFLEGCPIRKKIQDRVTEVWNYGRYSCPMKRGDKYYYYHNTGLQNQSVMYVQDSLGSEASVFFDPNTLSTEGTTSLRGTAFSEDGSLWAYGLSESGSDWTSIKFKKAPSAEDLPDVLKMVKFSSMTWTHDNKGLFYNRFPESEGKSDGTETTSNLNHKLYYHRMGTQQEDDVLVAEALDHPKWMIGAEVSDCGRYLILTPREGCAPVNRLYYVDLQALDNGINGLLKYTKIVDNFDAEYEYITNNGPVFTFKTNKDAPRYKLINIDITKPEPENWVTLVEQDESAVLRWVGCINDNKLILCYLRDVKNELYVYDHLSGKKEFQVPLDVGTVSGYAGKREHTEVFFQFMSFLTPGIIYRMDMTKQPYTPEVFREIKVTGFDASQFEVEQKFFPSQDGTKVPMFIVHKKGLVMDGSHVVLLYGYGGFSISITPSFSPQRTVFLQNLGGIHVVANIRGGDEYGEDWHTSGTLGNKQNGFNDFQAAAQFLIDSKYTSPGRLVINGGSNGGLLVGACLNQRPDLFGAGVAQVGVLDMLRFHKFTIGHAWTTDYGSSDHPEQFHWLIKYSPLHNIPAQPKGQYPALLLMTADHDDRVVPHHSLKFVAELQHTLGKSEKQTNPLLIRVDVDAGHGFGKPTAKVIEEVADFYSFICQTIGLQWTE